MKNKEEKLQKINEKISNVSGGEIDHNPLTGKWDVYDDKTKKRVASDLTQEEARYIDYVYHNRDALEKRARGEK